MIFHRQKYLLALLASANGPVGNLDFQKLLFLSCQECDVNAFYEFIPYRYGAFSFTSYADRRHLVESGMLSPDEHYWRLTQSGFEASTMVSPDIKTKISSFMQKYSSLRGDELVAETYRKYPYYGIKSEIAERVLHSDIKALKRIEEAKPRKCPGLLTIGYEGLSLEAYLNILIRSGVSLLCDVRRNPISRKYGFSKNTLLKACAGVGIRYEHLPDLGIASDQRKNLDTQAEYDHLFEEYKKNILPNKSESLELIRIWIREGESVALTCYEHLPEQCHRHCVAEAIESTHEEKIKIINL